MKLIIATNRAPYNIKKPKEEIIIEKSPGGLVAALDPVLKRNGGTWVCGGEKLLEEYGIELPYSIKQIKLSKIENKHYYEGFCNTQIWPLFHYFPTRYKLDVQDWNFYKQVNLKFAYKILEILEPDDKIWIHDYQLMILPSLLREKGVNNKIGFFLHIPFPNIEIYRVFPKRLEIIKSLLMCDLIGLHTPSYQKHFIESAKYLIGDSVKIDNNNVIYNERKTKIVALPISIDFKYIDSIAQSNYVENRLEELKHNFYNQIIGLGVDRLDYSKGIIEKFEGLEHFLDNNPEYIKKLSFIQIAVPTRSNVIEYTKLKRRTDETVGRINGKFSREGWSPIHYIYANIKFEDTIAYYRLADFIIVSALRDGLNLVAKEYVASRTNNGGSLILSEFTGVAEEMTYKYSINPYDVTSISNTINKVLKASDEVKTNQMMELRNYVKNNDIFKWLNDFLYEMN